MLCNVFRHERFANLCLLLLIGVPLTAQKLLDWSTCDLSFKQMLSHQENSSNTSSNSCGNLLYFLHIPRTAGRTYHNCFLKLAIPPSQRCEKSYDILRLNMTNHKCGLLSSHDDYSVLDQLPDHAAIITQLRDPIDRVLSTYEFAMEVAARAFKSNNSFATLVPTEATKTSTREVWPWSILVPFLEDDIEQRVRMQQHADQHDNETVQQVLSANNYNHPLLMPLSEFVEHPVAFELVHNGQTLQVMGLTNRSHWAGAQQARDCVQSSSDLQKVLANKALQRLQTFKHVGLTEMMDESVLSLAAMLNFSMDGPAWKTPAVDVDTRQQALHTRLDALRKALHATASKLAAARVANDAHSKGLSGKAVAVSMTDVQKLESQLANLAKQKSATERHLREVKAGPSSKPARLKAPTDVAHNVPLWRAHRQCVEKAHMKNRDRRKRSLQSFRLPDGRAVEFGRSARLGIGPDLLEKIRSYNRMDIALYQRGRGLLEARLEQLMLEGKLDNMPPLPPEDRERLALQFQSYGRPGALSKDELR